MGSDGWGWRRPRHRGQIPLGIECSEPPLRMESPSLLWGPREGRREVQLCWQVTGRGKGVSNVGTGRKHLSLSPRPWAGPCCPLLQVELGRGRPCREAAGPS